MRGWVAAEWLGCALDCALELPVLLPAASPRTILNASEGVCFESAVLCVVQFTYVVGDDMKCIVSGNMEHKAIVVVSAVRVESCCLSAPEN
eukprot:6456194-Amphidinium_carterae.2